FDNPASAKDFVRGEGRAFVVKADGLAKGKGTLVARDAEETLECIDTLMLRRTVGAAADRIVVEEKIDGREVSLLALVDGERILPFAPACDYKRALDGDKGPNTGGMGGYSPVSFFVPDAVERAVRSVLAGVRGSWPTRSSVRVVRASRGYPGRYATGYPIEGLGTIERDAVVFYAGATADPSGYVTAGGRVLTVVALGDSMAEARDR